MGRRVSVLFFLFLNTPLLLAKDFWEKPFSEWSQKEVTKMLTDSPWAQQHVFSRHEQDTYRSTGIGGEQVLYDAYTARFFTALPIRHAYIRMLQLHHKYDEMSAEQKQSFDSQTSGFLGGGNSDIIVALDFSSNDQSVLMNVRRMLQYKTTAQLKNSVYLFTENGGQVGLKEYFPPSQDGTGAKFVFPRTVDSKEVVTPKDKEIKFEFQVPDTGHLVYIRWRVNKMLYQGDLAF